MSGLSKGLIHCRKLFLTCFKKIITFQCYVAKKMIIRIRLWENTCMELLHSLYVNLNKWSLQTQAQFQPSFKFPKKIQKQELLKLVPLEWLTNYEHFHQNSEPVQTAEATFERRQNGQVKLSFQTPETNPVSETPRLSYTAMITAVQTGQEKKLPIHGFSSEGYPVYPDKINGHFL